MQNENEAIKYRIIRNNQNILLAKQEKENYFKLVRVCNLCYKSYIEHERLS